MRDLFYAALSNFSLKSGVVLLRGQKAVIPLLFLRLQRSNECSMGGQRDELHAPDATGLLSAQGIPRHHARIDQQHAGRI